MKNNRFILFLTGFLFLELLSFNVFLAPAAAGPVFIGLVLFILVLAIKSPVYGLLAIILELIVGSKGYLFYYELDGAVISLRMAIFVLVFSVWLARFITALIKGTRPRPGNRLACYTYAWPLFLFIFFGLANGLVRGHAFDNVFFDFNGWLFFLLALPLLDTKLRPDDSRLLLTALAAGLVWMALKTFWLLYFFSHFPPLASVVLYRWVRVTGVGEITNIQGGFYRIFIQSHIYFLLALFTYLAARYRLFFGFWTARFRPSVFLKQIIWPALFLAVVIISFSRSFWVGLAYGAAVLALLAIFEYKLDVKAWAGALMSALLIGGAALAMLVVTVKFPYPPPLGGFSTAGLLSERASELSGEAALASRWSLVGPLTREIFRQPVTGAGFGRTVTYETSDPRALEANQTRSYTTYAFEWGWLDIWLKLGLGGLLAYIYFLIRLIADSRRAAANTKTPASFILAGAPVGIMVLGAVNIFTPYLNHPLGIGYLLLIMALIPAAYPAEDTEEKSCHNTANPVY